MVQCPSFAAVTRSRGQNSRSRPLRKMNILARISGLIGIVVVSLGLSRRLPSGRTTPSPRGGLEKFDAMGDSSNCEFENHLVFVRGPSLGAAFVHFYSIVINLLRLLRLRGGLPDCHTSPASDQPCAETWADS